MPIFDVTQQGAGQGGDDTAILQGIINAAPAYSVIDLPPPPAGAYNLSNVLHDNGQSHITLRGYGTASRINGLRDFQTLFTLSGVGGWEFRNLYLYGPGNGRRVIPEDEGCGIQMISCGGCKVVDCRFENHGKIDFSGDPGIACVYLRGSCWECAVRGCHFEESNCGVNSDGYGVNFAGWGNLIQGNHSRNLRAHYIVDDRALGGFRSAGTKVCDNIITGHYEVENQGTERYGIQITGAQGTLVSGNTIRGCVSGIILLADCTHCQVADNYVGDFLPALNGGYGVWFRQVPEFPHLQPVDCGIGDLTVVGSPSDAIRIDVGAYTSISGNVRLYRPEGCGVRIASNHVDLEGVKVYEPGSHGVYVTGQSGSVGIGGMCRIIGRPGAPYESDAVRVDAQGGPVTVIGNVFWNGQPPPSAGGFRYGINAQGAGCAVEHAKNKYFRLQGSWNPAGLQEVA